MGLAATPDQTLVFWLCLGLCLAAVSLKDSKVVTEHRIAVAVSVFSIALGLLFISIYADLAYPHGPTVRFDEAALIEDTSRLDIPSWVRIVKRWDYALLIVASGAAVAGVVMLLEHADPES